MTPVVSAFGTTLAGAALRGAAVLIVAAAVVRALRGADAATRHRVWLGALLAQLALLPLTAVRAPWTFDVLPTWSAVREAAVPILDRTGARTAAPSTGNRIPPIGPTGAADDEAPDRPGVRDGRSGAVDPAEGGAALLLALWMAGCLATLTRYGVGRIHASRLAARAAPVVDPRWRQAVAASTRRLGVRRPVRLLRSDALAVPVTWGAARPTIVLPADAGGWSPERRRVILLHEIAHVRRLDAVWQAVAQLALGLFWFHPLVRLAVRRLEAEAEHACDDVVLAGGVRPSSYVHELVRVARAAARSESGLRTVSRLSSTPLAARARAILDPHRPCPGARRVSGRLATAGLAVAALPLAALRAPPATDGWVSAGGMESAASSAATAPATGCVYDGGRHLNRRYAGRDDSPVWQVAWSGDGCDVRFIAVGAVTLADDRFAVASMGPRARIAVEVRTDGETTRAVAVERAGEQGVLAYDVATPEAESADTAVAPHAAAAWFARFLIELDRHTGYAADGRVPALLARGGTDAVLADTERMQGDHAAGIYLRTLLRHTRPDDDTVRRILRLAAVAVANDAVLTELLLDLASDHDPAGAGALPEYLDAAATLESRAAREAVMDAVSRFRSTAARARRSATRQLGARKVRQIRSVQPHLALRTHDRRTGGT